VPSGQVQGLVQLLKSDGSQVLAAKQVVNPGTPNANCCLFSGFATDPAGNLYLTGNSYGAPVVLSNPMQSAPLGLNSFVAKLSLAGTGVFLGVAAANLPAVVSFSIAGTGCNAGAYPLATLLDVVSGTTCAISIPAQVASNGKRYLFYDWSDGSMANPRSVTPAANTTLQASFASQSKVFGSITPANGGSFVTNPAPATSDGYFFDNTQVTVTAVPAPGYSFASITAGTITYTITNQVTVTVPTTVSAAFSACTYSVSPSGTVAIGGGLTTQSVTVTTGAGCAWATSSSAAWLTVGQGSAGPGSVVYSACANRGPARSAALTIAGQTIAVNQAAGSGASNAGIFRAGFEWVLDANGNMLFDGTGPGQDFVYAFGGIAGDLPITGDWSGTGTTKIGIYRASNGLFLLDYNGNGTFDGCLVDRCYQYFPNPAADDIPVAGDWTGTGTAKIGIYRQGTGQWFLNLSGNGIYTPGVDLVTNYGGLAGDAPVTGDWTGSGATKIGIFRGGFLWILNTTGSGSFSAADAVFPWGGISGDVPVVGDWNGSGTTKAGVFRLGFFWVLDTNGDHVFTPGVDQAFPFGGIGGDKPVVGKW